MLGPVFWEEVQYNTLQAGMDNGCGGKKDGTISEGLVRLDRSTQGRKGRGRLVRLFLRSVVINDRLWCFVSFAVVHRGV